MFAQLITSFIASAAFGVIFNVPKNSLIQCGCVGMLGWALYFFLVENEINSIIATLAAAFMVAVISQYFAKRYKTPITVFNVSGIIPLVPGGLSYDAMKHFVENDFNIAVQLATKAFMLAGAIALGLIFAEVINQLITKYNRRKLRMRN
ncbi:MULTISPECIES: threonine/serine exporter family protein [unclassified Peribacillus]|uniref:threonine/serine exporter family protein n=1 Tax=unclassified Peribacillus TaxID=2675266 RepID=UPI0019136D8F|nr:MULTISPECIES: threonine/serine exporter family protein [unclassified Peribacillus]MBK5444209.1 threonine/serine exporter family protein [Peribacillus sp. TH24]MBK5461086.1 threonine/serine exporter family protein [Peribacillus sp. TH27]MBK5485594.1 threonine/serine exporter family protein [Peribacillus sp. TH16]MBK5499228.1 threonine/serine exporter family protein [Peribacillus sp. TH14]WMX55686.1 threonine/serine exporter family protein [Peribacillus sp. R9-11]